MNDLDQRRGDAGQDMDTEMVPRSRLARAAPAAVVLGAMAAVAIEGGVSVTDIGLYALRLVVAVILPGVLIGRLVRTGPRTGIEDLAVGFAIGTLVQVPVWWLFLKLGLSYWIWPALVVVAVAAIPKARRRVMSVKLAETPLGWSAAVASICLVSLAWLRGDFLRWSPPMPGEQHLYYGDLTLHMSIAADAKHSIPPTVPQVAGEPLYYHWLAHADMGLASRMTGIELATVLVQLWVPVILLAGIVVVAACGSRVTGRLWAGPLAAVLVYVSAEIVMGSWNPRPFSPVTQFYSWASPTQTLATVFAFPAAGVIIDYLRRGPGSTRQLWVLGVPLFLALAVAKSSELPVFIGGTAVLLLVAFLRRDRALVGRVLVVASALAATFTLATITVYGDQRGGLGLSPLSWMRRLTDVYTSIQMDAFPTPKTVIAVSIVTGIWAASVLARTWGIVLIVRHWRTVEPGQVLLAGILASGVGAYLVFDHPGGSQVYFLISAFSLGALASAWAICEWAPQLGARGAVTVGALTLAGGLAIYSATDLFPKALPARGFLNQIFFLATPALIVVATAAVLAVLVLAANRRGRLLQLSAVTVVTAVIIAGGITSTLQYTFSALPASSVAKRDAESHSEYLGVTDKTVAAARWLRDHTDSNDIVATNRHCNVGQVFPGTGPVNKCGVNSFWVSAWTERRALIEGWVFSSRVASAADPFWNPNLLRANDGFFASPSAEEAAILCKNGATYALLDRRYQPDLPSLEPVADLLYSNSDTEIYRLPC